MENANPTDLHRQVIQDYAKSWNLLQGYDAQSLAATRARQNGMRALALDDVLAALCWQLWQLRHAAPIAVMLAAILIATAACWHLLSALDGDEAPET